MNKLSGSFSFNTYSPSKWKCELFGMGNSVVVFPAEGDVPNWFWRKMQYLFFGNKWIKND